MKVRNWDVDQAIIDVNTISIRRDVVSISP